MTTWWAIKTDAEQPQTWIKKADITGLAYMESWIYGQNRKTNWLPKENRASNLWTEHCLGTLMIVETPQCYCEWWGMIVYAGLVTRWGGVKTWVTIKQGRVPTKKYTHVWECLKFLITSIRMKKGFSEYKTHVISLWVNWIILKKDG